MTDLRHIAQLLHEAGVSEGLGPTAMATWLGRRIHDAARDGRERGARPAPRVGRRGGAGDHDPPQQGTRVPDRVLPVHVGRSPYKSEVPVFHDPDNGNVRTIDVGHDGNELRRPPEDGAGREPGRGPPPPLRRPHPGPPPGGAVVGRGDGQPALAPRPTPLRPRRPGCRRPLRVRRAHRRRRRGGRPALGPQVSVERVAHPSDARWEADTGEPPPPRGSGLRPFARRRMAPRVVLEHHPGPPRTTRDRERARGAAHIRRGRADSRDAGRRRERVGRGPAAIGCTGAGGDARGRPGRNRRARRVRAHRVRRPGPRRRGRGDALDRELAWRNVDLGSTEAVVSGLCAAIESPLGPLVDDIALRDIARRDRLDELELRDPARRRRRPHGGAGRRRTWPTSSRSTSPQTTRWRATPSRLRDPALQRRPPRVPDREPRPGVPAPRRPLLPGRLQDEQARRARRDAHGLALPTRGPRRPRWSPPTTRCRRLLYSVALHRYLRWRLPGYDAARHLGGVLYLFVRGMSAVEPARAGEQPCGVWSWRPPAPLVESLSDLFDRGPRS